MNARFQASWARAALAGAVACLALLAGAQPPSDAPRRPGMGERPDRPGHLPDRADAPPEPSLLIPRLERRLEEARQEAEQLAAALERLRAGDAPAEVLRSLRADGALQQRPRERGGAGPFRGGPPGTRPPDDQRPRPEGERARPDSPDRERLVESLRDDLPNLSRVIDEVRGADPRAADALLERWTPRLRELHSLRSRDPDLYQLKLAEVRAGVQILGAVREVRRLRALPAETPDLQAQRDQAESTLRRAATEGFEARQAVQSHEVRVLSRRLEAMQARLAEQRANRDERITQFVDRLLDPSLPEDAEPDPPARTEGAEGPRPPR